MLQRTVGFSKVKLDSENREASFRFTGAFNELRQKVGNAATKSRVPLTLVSHSDMLVNIRPFEGKSARPAALAKAIMSVKGVNSIGSLVKGRLTVNVNIKTVDFQGLASALARVNYELVDERIDLEVAGGRIGSFQQSLMKLLRGAPVFRGSETSLFLTAPKGALKDEKIHKLARPCRVEVKKIVRSSFGVTSTP